MEFVIANAADIGPIPKHNFRKMSRVLLGENWPVDGRRVRNYVLHPEYGETYNTLALIQLKDPVRDTKIKPACPAPETLRNPVFYVMKFKDDYNELRKQVIPVAHVPAQLCKDFYLKANLYSKMQRPPHVACAVVLDEDNPCVWDAGAALVTRDVWGRWMLLGVGARGPGCGAPSRFLDMASYAAWVKISLESFRRVTITKLDKQKYVLRAMGGSAAPPGIRSEYTRYGACDPEEKLNLVYREFIRLQTDNTQYQFITYNLTILENVEFTCLTLELINASAGSEMSIRHYCDRESYKQPCYTYRSSIFVVSVNIMFSDSCLFEMYAWGHQKNMQLLDIQEWKWEEGTYYEEFSTARHEYRGTADMTEFGYEPVDQKMWVPEYDIWGTTQPTIVTTLPSQDYDEYYHENMTTEEYIYEFYISTARPKYTFKRRTRTTTTEIYFLWGVPRQNRTGEGDDTEDLEPHFFYRKNTTHWWK